MRTSQYLVIALTLLSACGSEVGRTSDPSAVRADGVVAKRADFPSVVGLVTRPAKGLKPDLFCSGTRIADKNNDDTTFTVITAAHCIVLVFGKRKTYILQPGDEIGLYSGTDWKINGAKHTKYGRVVAVASLPGYKLRRQEGDPDVGILKIKFDKDQLPSDIQAATLATKPPGYGQGGGYGVTGAFEHDGKVYVTDANPDLKLFFNRFKVEDVRVAYLKTHYRFNEEEKNRTSLVFTRRGIVSIVTKHKVKTFTNSISFGDSGGPLYASTADQKGPFTVLAGVHSGLRPIDQWQLHTNVSKVRSEIIKLQKTKPSRRPLVNTRLKCDWGKSRLSVKAADRNGAIATYFSDEMAQFPTAVRVVDGDTVVTSKLQSTQFTDPVLAYAAKDSTSYGAVISKAKKKKGDTKDEYKIYVVKTTKDGNKESDAKATCTPVAI